MKVHKAHLNSEQFDFPFVAELPTLSTQAPRGGAKGVRSKRPVEGSPPVAIAQGASGDPESMAIALEATGDYRILRRLKPTMVWPELNNGPRQRIAILDTETTGLDHTRDKVIELAMLCVDVDLASGIPVGEVIVYDGLEDPGIPIPKEVQEMTGITQDMVRGQRIEDESVLKLLADTDLVIAHNAGFDRPFCEGRLARFSSLPWACSLSDINWRGEGRTSAKLENLAQHLGFFYDAHRAEMDCHALLRVITAQLPVTGRTALSSLIQKADKPSFRLYATNAPYESKDVLKLRGYRWNAERRVWHMRLEDSAALDAECIWLKEKVYGNRSAFVQVEEFDALTRYSSRNGLESQQRL